MTAVRVLMFAAVYSGNGGGRCCGSVHSRL